MPADRSVRSRGFFSRPWLVATGLVVIAASVPSSSASGGGVVPTLAVAGRTNADIRWPIAPELLRLRRQDAVAAIAARAGERCASRQAAFVEKLAENFRRMAFPRLAHDGFGWALRDESTTAGAALGS